MSPDKASQLLLSVSASLIFSGVFMTSTSVLAATPLVICGSQDPAGNTEFDNVYVARGGHNENQLVIRNSNILQDFISKRAIQRSEINDRGEFIIQLVENSGSMDNGPSDRRDFTFVQDNQGNYILTVMVVLADGYHLGQKLAEFDFPASSCNRF